MLTPFRGNPLNPVNPQVCSKIVAFVVRVVTFSSGRRSRMIFFLAFVGQPHMNRLLLRPLSDHGRPKIVSKVGVSREESQQKSKKRRAKTSPAFSLDVFRTFFRQHRAKHQLLRPFL